MVEISRALSKDCFLNTCFIVTCQRCALQGLELDGNYFDKISLQIPNIFFFRKNIRYSKFNFNIIFHRT